MSLITALSLFIVGCMFAAVVGTRTTLLLLLGLAVGGGAGIRGGFLLYFESKNYSPHFDRSLITHKNVSNHRNRK